jgi:hypothetical protein
LQSALSKKKNLTPDLEKILEHYCQTNLFGLRDHYNTILPGEDNTHYLSSITRRHIYGKLFEEELFPLKDGGLQGEISHVFTGLVTFIESTFLINIATVRVKFAISSHNKPIFIGASDCFFTFKDEGSLHFIARNRTFLFRQ